MNNTYLETFTNKCNEQWWFDYNIENDMGIFWSNDSLILNKKFYIFDGIPEPNLILEPEEFNWLKDVWKKHSKPKNMYLNLDTKSQTTNKITYLENNYCPVCLNQRTSFEGHHCISSSEGGSDDVVNMLRICNTCHSLITNGCIEDKQSRYLTAIYHQICLYGIEFFKMNPLNNKRFKNQDRGFYKNQPVFKNVIDFYNKLTEEKEQIEFNDKFKRMSMFYYKYYRNVVRGIIAKEINNNYQAKIS